MSTLKGTMHWTLEERTRVRQWVAQGMNATEIGQQVGRSAKAVRNFVLAKNLGPWSRKIVCPARPVPSDFRERWERMSQMELAAEYDCAQSVIQRWCNELGLKRPKSLHLHRNRTSKPRARNVAGHRAPQIMMYHKAAPIPLVRDNSEAGLAADYLRQFGPIYRCSELGRADQQGAFWRRGPSVLNAEEVIERAVYNGFKTRQAA